MSFTVPYNSIDLFRNNAACNINCEHFISYTDGYLMPSDENLLLAIIPLKCYSDFDDYFVKCFSSKIRYKYRKVFEDGYKCRVLSINERNARLNELFEINTSADERQGKMNEKYFQYPEEITQNNCNYHFHKYYGAFSPDDIWIGYIQVDFCGEWANLIYILGHQKYMDEYKRGSFMLALWVCMVKDIIENHSRVKYIQYHLMNVGTPGLQEWKAKVGLQAATII